jgi:phosphoribosylaminoimidazole carboxylase PurE protein
MLVPILLGSPSDKDHAKKITDVLDEFNIPHEVIVSSAHKVPEKVLEIIDRFHNSSEEVVFITCAGMSNGLSGVTAGNTYFPVIACPPFKDYADYSVNIHSTLQMPSDTPTLTAIHPKNAALSVARIFGLTNTEVKKKLQQRMAEVKAKFN